jgi:hypothetical protein
VRGVQSHLLGPLTSVLCLVGDVATDPHIVVWLHVSCTSLAPENHGLFFIADTVIVRTFTSQAAQYGQLR